MDFLNFVTKISESVARLIESAAWPAIAAIAIFRFGEPLSKLILSIRKLKVAGAEIEIRENLAEAEEGIAEIVDGPKEPPAARTLRDAATVSPREAIIAAWIDVHEALVRRAQSQGVDLSARQQYGRSFERLLVRREIISAPLAGLIAELRTIRNQAAHEAELRLNAEDAARYVVLTQQVVGELDDTTADG